MIQGAPLEQPLPLVADDEQSLSSFYDSGLPTSVSAPTGSLHTVSSEPVTSDDTVVNLPSQ